MKRRPAEEVTVTNTGSLRVDPSKLLQTAEAQAQLKALKGLGIEGLYAKKRTCGLDALGRKLSSPTDKGSGE